MAKVIVIEEKYLMYECPGCECLHQVDLKIWEWNGSTQKPTIKPSVLVNHNTGMLECHHWVTDGMIDFKDDVSPTHKLAGKKVELPEI